MSSHVWSVIESLCLLSVTPIAASCTERLDGEQSRDKLMKSS